MIRNNTDSRESGVAIKAIFTAIFLTKENLNLKIFQKPENLKYPRHISIRKTLKIMFIPHMITEFSELIMV